MSAIDFTKLRQLADNMIKAGEEMRAALDQIDRKHLAVVVMTNLRTDGTLPEKVRQIQRVICLKYQVTPAELLSPGRKQNVAWARQVACWSARKLTTGSSANIGVLFGNRDHGTVLASCRRVNDLRDVDPKIKAETEAVLAECSEALTR